jgi:DNA polymerase
MNAAEKSTLARFLDLAGDYLRDGYRRERPEYAFSDDSEITALDKSRATVSHNEVTDGSSDSLASIAAEISACECCALCKGRKKTVPGEGPPLPLVMVIGEGPGADEDASGRPFVGRAGQLLDRMLDSRGKIALNREKNCFIANVVKCRPPENRNPLPDEIRACAPFLERQIRLLQPSVILAAGSVASRALLDTAEGVTKLRGRFFAVDTSQSSLYAPPEGNEPLKFTVLPTFHPSALLRDETLKAAAWEDMKLLRARLCEIDSAYAASLSAVTGSETMGGSQ